MATTLKYAWEKLYTAVRFMASSKADIRERLHCAYIPSIMSLSMDAMPDATLEKKLREIVNELEGKVPSRDRLADMSEDEASEWAKKIFDLFHDVKTEYDQEKLNR